MKSLLNQSTVAKIFGCRRSETVTFSITYIYLTKSIQLSIVGESGCNQCLVRALLHGVIKTQNKYLSYRACSRYNVHKSKGIPILRISFNASLPRNVLLLGKANIRGSSLQHLATSPLRYAFGLWVIKKKWIRHFHPKFQPCM